MSVTTIVALGIVLAIFVFLIIALSGGFGKASDWTGGTSKVNKDAFVFSCTQKCKTRAPTYCTDDSFNLIVEKSAKVMHVTCKQFESYPNSGMEACGEIDCNLEIISCDGLKTTLCSGESNGKCDIKWMSDADKQAALKEIGSGKQYKEVLDVTNQVTSIEDKNTNSKTPFCVKTILN